jgi:hypothetical protein
MKEIEIWRNRRKRENNFDIDRKEMVLSACVPDSSVSGWGPVVTFSGDLMKPFVIFQQVDKFKTR